MKSLTFFVGSLQLEQFKKILDISLEHGWDPEMYNTANIAVAYSVVRHRPVSKAEVSDLVHKFRKPPFQKLLTTYLMHKGKSNEDVKRIANNLTHIYCQRIFEKFTKGLFLQY
jgi:hypothetical protein